MKCGKGIGGDRQNNTVACPVAVDRYANGLNGGINGGRICWMIMECSGEHKAKSSCFQCEFKYKVMVEEGLLNICNEAGSFLKKSV